MEWLAVLAVVPLLSVLIMAIRWVCDQIDNAKYAHGAKCYEAGVNHGEANVRETLSKDGYANNWTVWHRPELFRLKSREQIADEVIAERKKAVADQQREQQERFREQWGNAVCKCEEIND